MLDDLRSAARSVTRARGLTAMLILSLALGTGANAAVSGLVYKLLLSAPNGVERAGELVSIYTSEFSGAPYGRTSWGDYGDIAGTIPADAVAAFDDNRFANARLTADSPDDAVPGSGAILRVRIVSVSEQYFDTLELQPAAGRLLAPADAAPTTPGAVVSHELAATLETPTAIVGRTLQLGARIYTVVGVTPERFRGLQAGRLADVWIPLEPAQDEDRGQRLLSIVARRSATLDEINGRLERLAADLATRHPETNRGSVLDPEAPRRFIAIDYSTLDPETEAEATIVAAVVLGAVVLLLVGACVNAGTLLLSRAMARRGEVAIKMALGAARRTLIRQVMLEGLLISAASGALGLVFATWIMRTVPAMFSPEQAALLDTRIDGLLVLLTLGVATVAGIAFGIAPAIHGTGTSAALALRADPGGISAGGGGAWMRRVLITTQLALSTLLLVATVVMTGALSQSLRGDFGVRAAGVLMITMQNPGGNCTIYDSVRGVRFHHAMAEQLPRTAGVQSAGWASVPPLGRGNARTYAVQAGARVFDRVDFNVTTVTPTYFDTLGIPLVEGRHFNADDGALAPPVAIVDELLARRHFGATAVGQHLVTPDGEPVTIVGVVKSGRYRTLQDSPQPTVYVPYAQAHQACGFLFVRSDLDPKALFSTVSRTLTTIDSGVQLTRAITIDEHFSEVLTLDRLTTTLVAACGLIALLMAMAGVYGVMSDAVLRRTREIGLRVALGAGRRQVAALVFTQAAYLAVTGVAAGLTAALVLQQVAASFVHGLPRLDAVSISAAPIALAIVILIAAVLPLRRALAVSPTIALRAE
ncbi:MAG TPA: ABC transporter permease [Vicinamibacterales bacterium]